MNEEATSEQIDEWIKKLGDDDFNIRHGAVWRLGKLKYELKDEKVRAGLLELARREKEGTIRPHGEKKSDEEGQSYMEYLSAFYTALASFNDPRMIPYLMDWIGGFGDADRGLLNLGEPAAQALLEEAEKGNSDKRWKYMKIFAEMVRPKEEGYMAQGDVRERMKKVIIDTCKTRNAIANKRAHRGLGLRCVQSLENLGDPEVDPLLKEMASHESFFDEKRKIYPVREAARKALENLPEVQRQRKEIEEKGKLLHPTETLSPITGETKERVTEGTKTIEPLPASSFTPQVLPSPEGSEKTNTVGILMALGVSIVGVGSVMFFIFKYRMKRSQRSSKTSD